MSRHIFDVLDAEYRKRRKQEREMGFFLLKLTLSNAVKIGILALLIGVTGVLFFGLEDALTVVNIAGVSICVLIVAVLMTWRTVQPPK